MKWIKVDDGMSYHLYACYFVGFLTVPMTIMDINEKMPD